MPKRDAWRRGSVTMEFALLSTPFFYLLIGIVELCLMEGAQQLLENAAFNASRIGKTGYVASGDINGLPATQASTILQYVSNELSNYGSLFDTSVASGRFTIMGTDYTSFSNAAAGGGTAVQNNFGGATTSTTKSIVAYTVTYNWYLFTPFLCAALISSCQTVGDNNVVQLTSTIIVQNEAY
jgi:Flp pilus assembly protein TadG